MNYPTLFPFLLRLLRGDDSQAGQGSVRQRSRAAPASLRDLRRRRDLQRRRLSQGELCLALRGQRRPGASI